MKNKIKKKHLCFQEDLSGQHPASPRNKNDPFLLFPLSPTEILPTD